MGLFETHLWDIHVRKIFNASYQHPTLLWKFLQLFDDDPRVMNVRETHLFFELVWVGLLALGLGNH